MATADLKLVYGGGGSFNPSFFSGTLTIGSGSSGNILTITPPAGKKVRLTGLASNTSTTETGISVTTSQGTVVSALTLSHSSGSVNGQFCVASNLSVGGTPSTNGIPYIDSITTIVINKNTGSTVNNIFYSYAYGD